MREYDLSTARWHKSTYSDDNGGNCVEIADNYPGIVPVRDSKVADGPVIVIAAPAWVTFIADITADIPG